jgi:hypothetical protein
LLELAATHKAALSRAHSKTLARRKKLREVLECCATAQLSAACKRSQHVLPQAKSLEIQVIFHGLHKFVPRPNQNPRAQ